MCDVEVGKLKAKQKQLEEQYRSTLIALGVEEQYALGLIKSARSTPREVRVRARARWCASVRAM